MIVLSKEQIEKMVDPDQMMDQIEEAYRIYGSGEFYMPPRPTVEHENKQLMYMPCYTKDIIGTKILSIFPENSKLGLPSIDGIVLLNDYTTGAPLAVMDGQSVTAWRTGAVGGVGILPSVKKGLPYGWNHRSRNAGIPSGCVCMCGKRYPYRICVQPQ